MGRGIHVWRFPFGVSRFPFSVFRCPFDAWSFAFLLMLLVSLYCGSLPCFRVLRPGTLISRSRLDSFVATVDCLETADDSTFDRRPHSMRRTSITSVDIAVHAEPLNAP